MVDFQRAGYCHKCNDRPCFEVLVLWSDGERYPGEPKRLGAPLEGQRVSLLLLDGSRIEPQICAECATSLNAEDYVPMWQRMLRSWKREIDLNPNEATLSWWASQFNNGILAEIGRKGLKEAHG